MIGMDLSRLSDRDLAQRIDELANEVNRLILAGNFAAAKVVGASIGEVVTERCRRLERVKGGR